MIFSYILDYRLFNPKNQQSLRELKNQNSQKPNRL